MMTICGNCKQEIGIWKLKEAIQQASNGMIQIRGECPSCRAWIKFVPYKESHHVKNILRLFYHNDLKALKKLREEVIYDYKNKEIR